jgi:hypothetical protein
MCSDGSGLRLDDIYAGLGAATKDGDRLRVRFTLYLLDGTIVSRGQVLHLALNCALPAAPCAGEELTCTCTLPSAQNKCREWSKSLLWAKGRC